MIRWQIIVIYSSRNIGVEMNQELIIKIKEDAELYFRNGNYYCSEAIVAAVRDNLDPNMPEALIACASGFPVGVGKSKCMCGAVSGGVIALGYFFGRSNPSTPQDEKSVNTLALAYELQDAFRQNHGCLCCSTHTAKFDMSKGEHKPQCIRFTGEMAEKTAEIILRELDKSASNN
jgi:C_GCAxxG_C_C family probable redox protein